MQLQYQVKGRVQGVNFRNTVKKYAQEKHLQGWVRNEQDGSVTIVVAGTDEQHAEFKKWLRHKPGFAKVAGIETTPVSSRVEGFIIKRKGNLFQDQVTALSNLGKSLR